MAAREDPTAWEAAEVLNEVRQNFAEQGIDAEIDVDFRRSLDGPGELRPLVKNIRMRTQGGFGGPSPAIESVARADPSNIQEVAASQLEISNSYYQSVLKQAQQSFRSALVAATVGLGFLVAALAFALTQEQPDAALLSAMSGAIVEGIAGLNFWLFGRTATQLDLFHVRLEQTQRFLLANSVCENLGQEARDTARADLVKSISTSPQQPAI